MKLSQLQEAKYQASAPVRWVLSWADYLIKQGAEDHPNSWKELTKQEFNETIQILNDWLNVNTQPEEYGDNTYWHYETQYKGYTLQITLQRILDPHRGEYSEYVRPYSIGVEVHDDEDLF